MSYAATINVSHISTSSKARGGLSTGAARKAALDNLSYITRETKTDAADIIGHAQGETLIATDPADRQAMRDMSRWAIDARCERHTDANGVRLADKMIVSLPADASAEHHREMVSGVLADLGKDSDAWLVAAIHRDRAGNPHAHILAIDGLESLEAAKQRRPDAKRVRRRDALRLNEGGNRKELRQRIAAQINAVSDAHGYRRAEIRSLADQGITRTPQTHLGPRGSARRDLREALADASFWGGSAPIKTPEITMEQQAPQERPTETPRTPAAPWAPPPAPTYAKKRTEAPSVPSLEAEKRKELRDRIKALAARQAEREKSRKTARTRRRDQFER